MHAVQRPEVMERGWKPNVEISPHCPRCGSSNTKFCYYNNYSLTQPRYFCKGCRRYWTKGGSLRNVPVGGGCRKHRRGKTTVRTSLSDHAPSRSNLAYGHHPYGLNGNPLIESSSSMHMMPNGSNIDLAVVYANFLNQQPDQSNNNAGVEILPAELPFDQFSISIHDTNFQLQQENIDLVGCTSLFDNQSVESHFCESHEMCLCGFDSIQKQQETCNYGLPGRHEEDIVGESQEMSWLSSQMTGSNQMLQSTQLMPGIEHEAQDLNQLVGNWSPFDLSSYNIQSTSPRP